ncbi:MAG: DUF4153 domain-containing protein [Gemmatimonadales bacterium]
MSFPAWSTLVHRARSSASRFPLVLAAGAIAAALGLRMVEGSGDHLIPDLAAAALGISLSLALCLTAERLRLAPGSRHLLAAASIPVCLLYLYVCQGVPPTGVGLRFLQLALLFHLAVAGLPYAIPGGRRGFWAYNRTLFERILVAAVYSGVLFIGLSVALLASDKLLGLPVPDRTYARLFVLLGFGFNTWFFLAGIPDDLASLDADHRYPIGLKVFAQYILLPLVAVYLTILTLYLGRVLVTRTWPSGWIGLLVSSVAVAGTLGLLLIHPVRERPEGRWVDRAARIYHFGMLPALVMALLAVGKRIAQYGVTEPRYALVVLAGWLLALSAYYLVSGSRSIRLIPLSLGAVTLVTAIGPWSMSATARRSQQHRFGDILAAHTLKVGQPLPDSAAAFTPLERRELRAVIRYLADAHGAPAVAPLIGAPTDSVAQWLGRRADTERVFAELGLSPFEAALPDEVRVASVAGKDGDGIARGFDALGAQVFLGQELLTVTRYPVGADTLRFEPRRDEAILEVFRHDSVVATFDLAAALDSLIGLDAGRGAVRPVVLDAAAAGYLIRLAITGGHKTPGAASPVRSVHGMVSIRPQ